MKKGCEIAERGKGDN